MESVIKGTIMRLRLGLNTLEQAACQAIKEAETERDKLEAACKYGGIILKLSSALEEAGIC